MKFNKILRTLALAIILALLMAAIPATPVLAAPVITLSPTSGAIGTRVTVSGINFGSYKGDSLRIFCNNVEIDNSPLAVPDTGSFSVTFDIPDDATPGTAWIIVRGELGSTLAKSAFTIQKAEITLTPPEGTVGTVVTVDGKGFYVNKMVTFYYYNVSEEKLGTEVASPIGEYSYKFTIPDSTAGRHKITAESTRGNSAEAEFEVLPVITLNPTSGAIGDTLTVSGTGFGYRSVVIIYFENTGVAYAKTDKYGIFKNSFKVPAMKAHAYEVKVKDEDGNIDKVEFTIIAKANLNKTMGNVGTEVIVSGNGFIASVIVTIKYDALEVATTTTNNNGEFSVAFKVPASISGKHLVTASDGINTQQLVFTMESEAPPVPTPLLPEAGTNVKSPVYFGWKEVNDPSLPITYHLQIASDKNFTPSSVVLSKEELTESDYTLTAAEHLPPTKKDTPYYWRVKALDSAANESEWSTPRSFYVGSPFALPSWAIYTLIGLGALIIGYLIFRLGRRTAYYQP